MTPRDDYADLIPWYANGTLDDEARVRLEAHLPGCASCRSLLAHARAFADTAPREVLDEHVQSQLLTEFADAEERLAPEVAARIRTHLDACEVCRDALSIVRELSAPPDAAAAPERRAVAETPGLLARLWEGLAGTVLQPAPALAYLIVLALVVPAVLWNQRDGVSDAPAGVPGLSLRMHGEPTVRGDEEPPPPEALSIRDAAGAPVLLELATDIDPADLADPDAAFRVELLEEGRVVVEQLRRGSDFDADGVLRLVVYPDKLRAGRDYTVLVRFLKTGDPLHERVVFRRSFRAEP